MWTLNQQCLATVCFSPMHSSADECIGKKLTIATCVYMYVCVYIYIYI